MRTHYMWIPAPQLTLDMVDTLCIQSHLLEFTMVDVFTMSAGQKGTVGRREVVRF